MTTLTFSHGIVSHSTNTGLPGGIANFLVINSDKVDINAPLDQPLVAAFAHRDANYLITLQSSSDIEAWGYGTASEFNQGMDNVNGGGAGTNCWFLYIDIDRVTGEISYGHSKYEPSSGSTAPFSAPPQTPAQRPDDLHWFDTTARTMKVWRASGVGPTYGKWVEVIRLFVAKYTYSANFSSLSANSPSFIGTTVGLTGSFKAGALVYDVIGNPLIRTTSDNHSVYFTTEDVFLTGMPSTASPVSGNRARYETFLVDAIGQTPQSAYTMVQFDDFNEVTPLQAGNEGTKIWGMIEFPVGASGDLVQVTMSGVVRNPLWNWSTVGQQIFVNKNQDGVLTTSTANVFPDQLPIGVVIDRTAILLRRPELSLVSSTGGITDHDDLTNNGGVGSHAVISSHISDSSIHFLKSSIALSNLSDTALSGSPAIDGGDVLTYNSSKSKWEPQPAASGGVTDHTLLSNIGTNTHAQIDTHIADSTIHFTEASIDHTNILNVGTNTHAQIDTHIADSTIHFTKSSINLDDLSNVASGSPAASTGDVLTWDGSQWEPQTPSGGGAFPLGSLTDITDSSAGSHTNLVRYAFVGDGSDLTTTVNDEIHNDTRTIRAITSDYSGDDDFKISITGNSSNNKQGGNFVLIDSDAINIGGSALDGKSSGGNFPGAAINILSGEGSGYYGSYAGGVGGDITIESGKGGDLGANDGGAGGNLTLTAGAGGQGDYYAGGDAGGAGGAVSITAGTGGYGYYGGVGGGVNIYAGDGYNDAEGTGSAGGGVTLKSGAGFNAAAAGDITIRTGSNATFNGGDGGDLLIYTGNSGSGTNGNIQIRSDDSSDVAEMRFYESSSTGTDYVSIKAPTSASGSRTWTLPDDDPTVVNGQFLTTNASGNLSFAAAGGGGSSSIPYDIAGQVFGSVPGGTGIDAEILRVKLPRAVLLNRDYTGSPTLTDFAEARVGPTSSFTFNIWITDSTPAEASMPATGPGGISNPIGTMTFTPGSPIDAPVAGTITWSGSPSDQFLLPAGTTLVIEGIDATDATLADVFFTFVAYEA